MEYKTLMENWRRFVQNEEKSPDYDPDGQQKEKLENLLPMEYESFVDTLKRELEKEGDPKFQRFLNMGIAKFDGDATDDVVSVDREASIPVKDLAPTQNQIGIKDSLGWLAENKPDQFGEIAELGPGGEADIGGRIITANGKYVVDGHHRWSMVYFINPEANIPTYNFNVPGLKDGAGALKLAQLAIAAVDGEIPKVNADAETDIYGKTKGNIDKIKEILIQPGIINDTVIKSLAKAWKSSEMPNPSREQIIDRLAENAKSLHDKTVKSASKGPARSYMPQPAGTEEKPTEPIEKIDVLDKGIANWNPKA